MEIIIRKAKHSDTENLAVLKQQVWISTYATEGLTEVFSGYVLNEYSPDKIRISIGDPDKMILLATISDCLVACAEIGLIPQSPGVSVPPCPEISTLYVLGRFQGMGIGKMLLNEAMSIIKHLGFGQCWLTVYYKNSRAIDFYNSQDFVKIGETDFLLGVEKYKNEILLKDIDG